MAEILQDPGWHLFDLEADAHTSQWLQLSEAQFRAASFLDQRLLLPTPGAAEGRHTTTLPIAELLRGMTNNPPRNAHFIFHIGHCGSTLISRALAATPSILPLREPMGLRQLAATMGTVENDTWLRYLQFVLAAHSRVFHSGQISMIKATSTCNALILPILDLLPESRVLLLYVRLENFLAGMLGKQTPARDLQGHSAARLQEWQSITGTPLTLPANEMSEGQLAVVSWLTSMSRLLQANSQHHYRCRLLDFDDFLKAPEAGLMRLSEFFHLDDAGADLLAAWLDVSLGYSKLPEQPYSAFDRNRTLLRGRVQRSAEIQAALHWAQQLIEAQPALNACGDYF